MKFKNEHWIVVALIILSFIFLFQLPTTRAFIIHSITGKLVPIPSKVTGSKYLLGSIQSSGNFEVSNVAVCKKPNSGSYCEDWFRTGECQYGYNTIDQGDNVYIYWEMRGGQRSDGCYWWEQNPFTLTNPRRQSNNLPYDTKGCPNTVYSFMCNYWGVGPLSIVGNYQLDAVITNKYTGESDGFNTNWDVIAECSDSDGGKDVYVPGRCVDTYNDIWDHCWDETSVMEQYCRQPDNLCFYEVVVCPDGYVCKNTDPVLKKSKCVKETTTPILDVICLYFMGKPC